MKRTILTLILMATAAGPVAAQSCLLKLILKRRLSSLELREERIRGMLGDRLPDREMSDEGYQYNESYQPLQPAQQMQAPAPQMTPAPAQGYNFQQNYQQTYGATQTYGSQGSANLGAYSQYQTQAAPASVQTFQGPPITHQHVETITQHAPIVTQSVQHQPAIIQRQSHGSQGSAVTHIPHVPAGYHSVLSPSHSPFSYGK